MHGLLMGKSTGLDPETDLLPTRCVDRHGGDYFTVLIERRHQGDEPAPVPNASVAGAHIESTWPFASHRSCRNLRVADSAPYIGEVGSATIGASTPPCCWLPSSVFLVVVITVGIPTLSIPMTIATTAQPLWRHR